MFLLWIVGLAFVGSGLAALVFGLRGLETQFGSALLVGGMTFISSGFVIAALGLVIRQLGRLRDALDGRVAGADGMMPAIEIATMERPSPARNLHGIKGNSVPAETNTERSGGGVSLASRSTWFERRASTGSTAVTREADAAANVVQAGIKVTGLAGRRPERQEIRQTFAVIQSGTVNNMNYELHADETIVAMLPGRALEFSSVDELRKYLAAHPEDGEASPFGRNSA